MNTEELDQRLEQVYEYYEVDRCNIQEVARLKQIFQFLVAIVLMLGIGGSMMVFIMSYNLKQLVKANNFTEFENDTPDAIRLK